MGLLYNFLWGYSGIYWEVKGLVPFDYLQQLTCNAATFHDFPFPSGNQTWLDEQSPIYYEFDDFSN
jgi:hypothetical protein